jgi:hypothetical protein
MKLIAVSPWVKGKNNNNNSEDIRQSLLAFIQEANADLIVLPGYHPTHPSPQEIQKVIGDGKFVFVEQESDEATHLGQFPKGKHAKGKKTGAKWKASHQACLVSQNEIQTMPLQCFANQPTRPRVESLEQIWQQRRFVVNNIFSTFVLCGEIDTFDTQGAPKFGANLPFAPLLINPTHTTRGHWNYLGPKLAALSENSVVVHVANNNRKNQNITTGVRIYQNTQQVGVRQQAQNLSWVEVVI